MTLDIAIFVIGCCFITFCIVDLFRERREVRRMKERHKRRMSVVKNIKRRIDSEPDSNKRIRMYEQAEFVWDVFDAERHD